MASFNEVILIGNMTADPELKQTTGGLSVCSFSIAVNRRFKGEGGQQECDFITVVVWRHNAEFVAQWFKKGTPILVCGQLQTRSWTDKEGNKRTAVEVVADEVSFVAPSPQSQPAADRPRAASAAPPNPSHWGNKAYTPEAYTQPSMAFSTPVSQRFEEIPNDEGLPF